MAVPDHSIDPRILECAKQEFLSLGYEKASLKHICEEAGVTTGALYKRYKGKDDLFAAVVSDTITALDTETKKRTDVDVHAMSDQQLTGAWDMNAGMRQWFQFLYGLKEGFTLLVKCSAGSSYSNFEHEFVEKMCVGTYSYYREAYRRGLAKYDISPEEMHIILSAFWQTVYEPFIHDFDWTKLKIHCATVNRLFDWYGMLGIPNTDTLP
ncbi:TetR/AcrR family transcriptional regulator [Diplocloster modestus]|uniref:TetR/AcrR family transcriptional regulator n=1 Tax=Diplocloster modestus TaxID=2850322 RepID=A0ABS6K7W3_9FIRM|nr:TetR/AcrR family transcriptional regulator [Diplocloster modestus]MBU9726597.1 TetR/AcrR family transcriptional regulator [Diplocloster modestus]